MSIGNVSGVGVNPYASKNSSAKAAGTGNFAEAVQGAKNVVHIAPDALFAIHDVKTGESAYIYRSDDYSEDNSVYLVKGTDINGKEYEQTVDVSKVNPNSCSYTEMLALNAHTGDGSASNFMTMAILKDKAGSVSYHEKADYIAMGYALMNDMKTLGNWDGYLRYGVPRRNKVPIYCSFTAD